MKEPRITCFDGVAPVWIQEIVRRLALVLAIALAANASVSAQTAGKKPNILVIMGDDIGWFNPSCYNSGLSHTEH